MAVTMLDIARDLKVSVVTVSKVLRNKGNISVATRKRVLRRAKKLNYQTNWIARSLVTQRPFTIALLLPDFTHPFFAEIAKAVAETVRPRGYHVIISYFEENPELERNEAESLLARQVDGLTIASGQHAAGHPSPYRARLPPPCAFARSGDRHCNCPNGRLSPGAGNPRAAVLSWLHCGSRVPGPYRP